MVDELSIQSQHEAEEVQKQLKTLQSEHEVQCVVLCCLGLYNRWQANCSLTNMAAKNDMQN